MNASIARATEVLAALRSAEARTRDRKAERTAAPVLSEDAWRERICAVMEPLAKELCRAIDADRRFIELGTWRQPYRYDRVHEKPTFEPPEKGIPSVLVPLFVEAAEAFQMDVFCKALEEVLKVACEERVQVMRHNIARIMILPTGREPRNERMSLLWEFD